MSDDPHTLQLRIFWEADDAWSEALKRTFGMNAGDARYDARGYSTPELKRLHDRRMMEMRHYFDQQDSRRAVLSGARNA